MSDVKTPLNELRPVDARPADAAQEGLQAEQAVCPGYVVTMHDESFAYAKSMFLQVHTVRRNVVSACSTPSQPPALAEPDTASDADEPAPSMD